MPVLHTMGLPLSLGLARAFETKAHHGMNVGHGHNGHIVAIETRPPVGLRQSTSYGPLPHAEQCLNA
jgi:hypothetical protein